MITSICLGFFGTICAFAGMKCTRIGGNNHMKAKIVCLAGILLILSGTCSLAGCSLYAHKTTSEYFDLTIVTAKYELGTALFIGWAGSVLCLIGGFIFCCTFPFDNVIQRSGYRYATASANSIHSMTKIKAPSKLMHRDELSQTYNKNSYV